MSQTPHSIPDAAGVPAGTAPAAIRARRRHLNLWRHRSLVLGGIIVGVIVVAAVLATFATPYDPNKQNYAALLQGMSGQHWLGTDQLGRDVFSRILVGARTSLAVAAGAVAVALVIGVPVGLVSGFYRGFWDNWVIMRIVDALQAFPFLILALVLAAVMGPGIRNAMIAIGVGYLPVFIRIVRGQVLAEVRKEYVDSARVVGCSDWRIMLRHIFPNITTPLIVQVSIAMAGGIVAEASLSYLGLGVIPPTASWGTMLHDAQGYLSQDAMLAVIPGVAIAVAVLGFNLLGEGLQEIWDPKLKE
ncbi:ABC transporter permease [Alicyclobacillus macrosporangiidus]|uniref:Peptide/nickel transport system permease protein n=1 Tax=Alicyclobacillus macrosporangiidus TaxID=392015 RepID=A0A1I7J2A5_9BACL|nr:ABC transporter permease [Alicyclobacillus macrosporangiidus]SFU79290.1 peptide/nickel transport system permease protein [Alicyclobacillus macrosporangiidus]